MKFINFKIKLTNFSFIDSDDKFCCRVDWPVNDHVPMNDRFIIISIF